MIETILDESPTPFVRAVTRGHPGLQRGGPRGGAGPGRRTRCWPADRLGLRDHRGRRRLHRRHRGPRPTRPGSGSSAGRATGATAPRSSSASGGAAYDWILITDADGTYPVECDPGAARGRGRANADGGRAPGPGRRCRSRWSGGRPSGSSAAGQLPGRAAPAGHQLGASAHAARPGAALRAPAARRVLVHHHHHPGRGLQRPPGGVHPDRLPRPARASRRSGPGTPTTSRC